MKNNPCVSVIMSFLNAERFISEAIESIISQTYSDWKLLLVDDGSSDKSTTIAKKYADKYPEKILYVEHLHHQNVGASASRNIGLALSKGKYIAILDSDDVWLPNKLAEQIEILINNPGVSMVCGSVLQWFSWEQKKGMRLHKDVLRPVGTPQNTIIHPPQAFNYLYPLRKGFPPTPSDLMIKKEDLEKIGGFEAKFRNQYQLYEDQCLLTKIYLQFSVYVASSNWTKYRRHPAQCISTVPKAGQYYQARKFFLGWFEKYLLQHGFQGTEVWYLLQKSIKRSQNSVWLGFKEFFRNKILHLYD